MPPWCSLPCPHGAHCNGHVSIGEIRALAGYWRIPWSPYNITFQRCPFRTDCLGSNVESDIDTSDEKKDGNASFVEGCKFGTKGPLCSLCIPGYNRDVNECTVCVNEAVPMRVGILVAITMAVVGLLRMCKQRIKKSWKKYKFLYRDFLRIIAINVTFAQINSSLPSVIDVEWPQEWTEFVKNFSFVNIDIMSLLGMKCLGDFDYYLSFVIMTGLPMGILVITIGNYCYSVKAMKHQLDTMTSKQKQSIYKDALHALFELTDAE